MKQRSLEMSRQTSATNPETDNLSISAREKSSTSAAGQPPPSIALTCAEETQGVSRQIMEIVHGDVRTLGSSPDSRRSRAPENFVMLVVCVRGSRVYKSTRASLLWSTSCRGLMVRLFSIKVAFCWHLDLARSLVHGARSRKGGGSRVTAASFISVNWRCRIQNTESKTQKAKGADVRIMSRFSLKTPSCIENSGIA